MHGVPPPPNRFRAARLYERNAMDFVDLHLAVRFGSAAKERGGAGGAGFWHPVWGKAGGPKPGAAGPRQPQQPQQQQHQQQQPEAPGGEGRADGASPAPGVGGAEGGPAAPTAGPEATGEHPQPAVDGQPGNDEAEPPAVSWASPERTSVVEPPADDAAADVDDPQSSDEPEESEQTPETEGSHDSNEELPKVVLLKDNAVEDR
ncbi:hypothetical protein DIPPA_06490 [Diplonema papillatum]|nr:hypothetical protein DIPPA_06490 [Diplonema papillatum]